MSFQPTYLDFQGYQMMASRTAKDLGSTAENLVHAALGLAGESGEFTDAIKKHVVYSQELDRENCLEEIGDILWFCALACNVLGVDMSQVAVSNLKKLKRRYPEKYSEIAAAMRADKI